NTYFTRKEAEFRTYYWDRQTPNKVEAFAQDTNFMLDFEQFGQNIHQRPTVGQSLGWIDYSFPMIDARFLEQHFKKTGAVQMIKAVEPSSSNSQKSSVSIFRKIKNAFFS